MMRMALLSTGCGLLLLACVDSETDPVIDYLSGGGAGYTEVEPSGGSEGGSSGSLEQGSGGETQQVSSGGTTGAATGGADSTGSGGSFGSGGVDSTGSGGSFGSGGVEGGSTGGSDGNLNVVPEALPTINGPCPDMTRDGIVEVDGAEVRLWVGAKPGPVYFYFHGTGTFPSEVETGIPGATAAVNTEGGFVASWSASNGRGVNTGTIWYTGDLDAVDQLVACGIEQGLVDPSRIHAAGYSAGGLEVGAMVFSRSSYLASAIVYSGGKPIFGVSSFEDPTHIPAVLGAHGAPGLDSLVLDFGTLTPALVETVQEAGGFGMDCNDGRDHIGGLFTRLGVGGQARQFFADHPFDVASPYGDSVPAGFPDYCEIP